MFVADACCVAMQWTAPDTLRRRVSGAVFNLILGLRYPSVLCAKVSGFRAACRVSGCEMSDFRGISRTSWVGKTAKDLNLKWILPANFEVSP